MVQTPTVQYYTVSRKILKIIQQIKTNYTSINLKLNKTLDLTNYIHVLLLFYNE